MRIVTAVLLIFVIFITQSCVVNMVGGAFDHEPEEMEDGLSIDAKEFLDSALSDLQGKKTQDYHTHILGLGNSGSGIYVNKEMSEGRHLFKRLKFSVYLSSAGITDQQRADEMYLERLRRLISYGKVSGQFYIMAFDRHYNYDGSVNEKYTEFYIPNQYVFDLANKHPEILKPVISVHPYRKDAVERLEYWARQGVRMMKWLPNAQGIDAADARLDEYYGVLKKYNMALLTHVGKEQAIDAEEYQELGNPLRFRRALDLGVTVIMAHSASLGKSQDFDNDNKPANSFDLFLRMMDESKYIGKLYGEISSITQFNRLPDPLLKLLERDDLHSRLVNGSDYPLPAVNILIHTRALYKYGFITAQERQYLNEIYDYNPLLFDLVVKRTIRSPSRLPSSSPARVKTETVTDKKFHVDIFTRDIFAEQQANEN